MNIPPGSRSKVFLVPLRGVPSPLHPALCSSIIVAHWGLCISGVTQPVPLSGFSCNPLPSREPSSVLPRAAILFVPTVPTCTNHHGLSASTVGLGGPVLDYSRPRTEQPGMWLLMCLLCAKWSLWLPGMDCSALADAASCLPVVVPASVFVCLPFFTPGRGETLKPITQMRGLRATDSPGLEPPGPSCWPVASQA